MAKNIQSLKVWYSVASPSRWLMFLQFMSAAVASVFLVLSKVPAASAIARLTVADYRSAAINLLLALFCEFLAVVFKEVNCRINARQLGFVYPRIQERLFKKIYLASSLNFQSTSKEKMINIITSNISSVANFCSELASSFSYLVEGVITLVIIFLANTLVGVGILVIALLVYLMISALNIATRKRSLIIQSERDSLTENFVDLVDGRELADDLNLVSVQHDKYFERVNSLMREKRKSILLKSIRDNWVYLFYTAVIAIASIYLTKMIEANTLTTTLYLIVTPYLTTAITDFSNFFGITTTLQDAGVSAMRIKTLLDMSDKDFIGLGKNSTDNIGGAITFSNVKYNGGGIDGQDLISLQPFSAQISSGKLALFEGAKGCGKRVIFYMLRRTIRPSEGTITFDAINIFDFDKSTFTRNISYATSKPYFFNDTILQNLKFVEPSKRKIIAVCKDVGIHEVIEKLQEGYNTNLVKTPAVLNGTQKFLLAIARALLAGSEILMIYEFPVGMPREDILHIKRLLTRLKRSHTIIVFSSSNPLGGAVDIHFNVDGGKVSEVKV